MPTGSRSPFPTPPDLPSQLEPAAAVLASGDGWEGVSADADTSVDETVFDVELREVVWTNAQLVGRRFAGLRCEDVRFVQSDLAGAVLEDCGFTRVVFDSCRLSGAVFAGSTLQEIEFVNCVANRADFRMARVRRSAADGSDLRETDFYGCRLTDVRLSTCDLSGADFQTAVIERVDLRDSTVDGLRGVDSLGGAHITLDQVAPLGAALVVSLGFRVE